jgi:hypothetical protein
MLFSSSSHRLRFRFWDRYIPSRKFEQSYKDSEKERDALKKSTQQKFQKLTAKNQASDKLVSPINTRLCTHIIELF